MLKAYKYRIYPDDEQKGQLSRIFGSCRFVYNKILAYRKECFEKNQKQLKARDCIEYFNQELKPENTWLDETDQQALISSIYHLDIACRQAYRSHRGYPKYKSKYDSRKSYTTNMTQQAIEVDFTAGTIKLPMLTPIKAKLHREFCGQIKSAAVSLSSGGKYYAAILVDAEHQELPRTDKNISLDLMTENSCITSDGQTYIYNRPQDASVKRLARLQGKLKRKERGSSNYYKLKKEIALCHERISNSQKDNLHKIAYDIVKNNQTILVENVQTNTKTGEHYSALNDFLKVLEYKAKWNNRDFVKIDK